MTGVRASAVMRFEKRFGVSRSDIDPSDPDYLAPNEGWLPIGDKLETTFTPNNNWTVLNSIGTKFRTGEVAGKFDGTFSISTLLDYYNIYILATCMEGYAYDYPIDAEGNYRLVDPLGPDNPTNYFPKVHTFKKADSRRVPSFEVKQKVLNKMVDGSFDVTRTFKGCVVNNAQFNQDTSKSTLGITLPGKYRWQIDKYEDLPATDWVPYIGDKIEWNCLSINGEEIANVETLGFGVNNNSDFLFGTCSRKSSGYYEKNAVFAMNATVYSNRPELFQQRIYSGGFGDYLPPHPTEHGLLSVDGVNPIFEPLKKNLKPIPQMEITSPTADGSDRYCEIILGMVTVSGYALEAKTDSKMVDKPTLSPRKWVINLDNNITTSLYDVGYLSTDGLTAMTKAILPNKPVTP